MKYVSAIILLYLLSSQTAFSQYYQKQGTELELSALYLGIGGGVTNNGDLYGLGACFLLSNHWGGSISMKVNSHASKNLPSDYQSGFTILSDGNINDKLKCITIAVLREFSPDANIRFVVEAGPSYNLLTQPEFTPVQNPGWLSSNYDVSTHNVESTVGLSMRGKAEWAFSKIVGLEIASFSNINTIQPFTGVEICLNMGFVRKKHKRG